MSDKKRKPKEGQKKIILDVNINDWNVLDKHLRPDSNVKNHLEKYARQQARKVTKATS